MKGLKEGAGKTGMEYFAAIEAGEIAMPPVLEALGFKAEKVEPGVAVFAFIPQEFHYNLIGTVHGGVISTVLDSAMGCSLHSLLPVGVGYTTLELKVNFLKAVTMKSGPLRAVGKIIHAGSRTALVEAQLLDHNNTVFAHGVSTCLILDLAANVR